MADCVLCGNVVETHKYIRAVSDEGKGDRFYHLDHLSSEILPDLKKAPVPLELRWSPSDSTGLTATGVNIFQGHLRRRRAETTAELEAALQAILGGYHG